MNRFNKEVTVEVVKKKRRRPLNPALLTKPKTDNEKLDIDVNHALDIVTKRKKEIQEQRESEKKRQEELQKQKAADNQKSEDLDHAKKDNVSPATEEATEAKTPSASPAELESHEHHKKPTQPAHTKSKDKKDFEDEEKSQEERFKGKLNVKSSLRSRYSPERRRDNKVLIQNIDVDEERNERRSFASVKRAREKARKIQQEQSHEKQIREVILPEFITVSDLAARMSEKGSHVIKELMKLGVMVTLSQTIDADTAELVIHELGHKIKRITDADVENILVDNEEVDESKLQSRPPVVTVVGHVDHGKTSLLDALRETNVTSSEAGGITQHIGAYQVSFKKGDNITFIDTPGHEAFTSMRSRGVNITDIVILVVAADDGIKAQTIEAINHAKAAKVPIIVAINKIDKEGADPNKVVSELLSYDLIAESMGGDIMIVEVSALKKLNLDKLLEAILLQSEMLELKAQYEGKAKGVVIESRINKNIGVIATILVQKGTVRKGDIIVAGTGCGKIKALLNDHGKTIEKATPSVPVEIIGFDNPPDAGEIFSVVDSDKQAREICEYRRKKASEQKSKNVIKARGSLDDLFKEANKTNNHKTLAVIIKADVHGSVEAISSSLQKIESDEIDINILHRATGGITESDVSLAKASNALIIAFNVRANNNAKILAEKENIEIRYYSIIYELIDEIKNLMSGMLEPIRTELYIGKAEIRQIFNISKIGKVGGSFVTDGNIKRGAGVRLIRDNVVIHEGKLKTLKRFKEDVKEVATGYECGIAFENYEDIKEGDVVEAFEVVEKTRKL